MSGISTHARLRRVGVAAAALALLGAAAALSAGSVQAHQQASATPARGGGPVCGASAADPGQPTNGRSRPPAAPRYFAADFPAFADDSWGDPVGGFGGLHRGAPLRHTPVIFVHGNQADASNWLDVMLQFQHDAGYSMQEMYAISYNGLENAYAGQQTTTPSALDNDYLEQNPNALANGGHGAADDDEVPDLCRFVEAVQAYTGSTQVDVVTHSLGVTIVRKMMLDYPQLARDVVAFIGIAGANHGTTVCAGLQSTYYGCNEISQGSAWLDHLNGLGGSRETYAPVQWMTVYDGSGAGDPFFDGPTYAQSPALRGADNRQFARAYHNDLRVGVAEVDTYLPFLLRHGQAGRGADHHGAAAAARIEATQPDGTQGPPMCGIPALTGPVASCPAS